MGFTSGNSLFSVALKIPVRGVFFGKGFFAELF
jgi:hypothetical protein